MRGFAFLNLVARATLDRADKGRREEALSLLKRECGAYLSVGEDPLK